MRTQEKQCRPLHLLHWIVNLLSQLILSFPLPFSTFSKSKARLSKVIPPGSVSICIELVKCNVFIQVNAELQLPNSFLLRKTEMPLT